MGLINQLVAISFTEAPQDDVSHTGSSTIPQSPWDPWDPIRGLRRCWPSSPASDPRIWSLRVDLQPWPSWPVDSMDSMDSMDYGRTKHFDILYICRRVTKTISHVPIHKKNNTYLQITKKKHIEIVIYIYCQKRHPKGFKKSQIYIICII
jgi:hypothetical protein